jgi:Xaa-Pro aminopeptidase
MEATFIHRQKTLSEKMLDKNLDVVLVYSNAQDSSDMRYLTGYFPLCGDALYLQTPWWRKLLIKFSWDLGRALLSFDQSEVVISSSFVNDLESIMGKEKRIQKIGVVGWEIITYRLGAFLTEFSGKELINLDPELHALRLIKTQYEIKMIEKAIEITEEALKESFQIAGIGTTEKELAAYQEYLIKKQGADLAFETVVASGENSLKIVSLPTERKLQAGDTVILDTGAKWNGYCSDLTRTLVVGEPTSKQKEVHQILTHILDLLLHNIKPGIKAKEVHQMAQDLFQKAGLGKLESRIGHGIGLDTSLEPLDLQTDEFPLMPGMTFCIEPGYYGQDSGGIRVEDDVLVTAEGCQRISTLPVELLIIK